MVYDFRGQFLVAHVYGISISVLGTDYYIVFGKWSEVWFIAIVNRGVVVRAAQPDNIAFNVHQLSEYYDSDFAVPIATAISDFWSLIS